MPIIINGSGTLTGVSVGGLPDAIVDTDMIASEAVTKGKQGPGSVIQWIQAANSDVNARHSESAGNWESTGIHVDITPTNSSNLIVVGGFVACHSDTASRWLELAVHNGTSRDENMTGGCQFGSTAVWNTIPIKYSQTAGTTSQLTFTLYMKNGSGSNNIYVGWASSPGSTKNWNDFWAAEVVV